MQLRRVDDTLWEIPREGDMRVPARVFADDALLESIRGDRSLEQLRNVATLPGIVRASLAMPDIHQGYGLPVGGVVASDAEHGTVSPGAIGFDINCGVRLLATPLGAAELEPRLPRLVDALYDAIPTGVGSRGAVRLGVDDLSDVLVRGAAWAVERGHGRSEDLRRLESGGVIAGAVPDALSTQARERGLRQLGSLGSGNHFLEVQVIDEIFDEAAAAEFGLERGRVTVMIHTGSRGLGHQVCTDFLRVAEGALSRYGISVPDRQLACAPVRSPEAQSYLGGMRAAANFAFANRQLLAAVTRRVLEQLVGVRPDDVVTVKPLAANVGESSANLRAGERLTVRELLEAALIQSANDAADALAFYVGHGSEERFVAMMNAKARRLGLRDTHYDRPDGLDAPGHVSSARDVTLLARILMHRPLVRQIVRQRTAAISGGRTLHTWNDLLSTYPGLFGVKTGHTAAAGWSEVGAARRSGVTVYATLLGSPDRSTRNRDLTRLLDWGFSRYRTAALAVKGRAYARAEVGYGRSPVSLVAAGSLAPSARVDLPLVLRVVAADAAELPVTRGQTLGRVELYQRGRLLGRVPLVAARSASRPGLWGRVGWYARRTLHHVGGWFT
jgi:tRNA-splicing ligase RtcB